LAASQEGLSSVHLLLLLLVIAFNSIMKPAEIQISIIDHKKGEKMKFPSNSAGFLLGFVFELRDISGTL
jgi:hypothetical protein